jgi:hypothetical protein
MRGYLGVNCTYVHWCPCMLNNIPNYYRAPSTSHGQYCGSYPSLLRCSARHHVEQVTRWAALSVLPTEVWQRVCSSLRWLRPQLLHSLCEGPPEDSVALLRLQAYSASLTSRAVIVHSAAAWWWYWNWLEIQWQGRLKWHLCTDLKNLILIIITCYKLCISISIFVSNMYLPSCLLYMLMNIIIFKGAKILQFEH